VWPVGGEADEVIALECRPEVKAEVSLGVWGDHLGSFRGKFGKLTSTTLNEEANVEGVDRVVLDRDAVDPNFSSEIVECCG
jgi:hypothetical protein